MSNKNLHFNPTTKPFTSLDQNLSHQQIKEDVNFLITTLNRAYSGSRKLPNDQYAGMIKQLEQIQGPKTIKELGVQISQIFNETSDSHLAVHFKGINNQGINFRQTTKKELIGPNVSRGEVWKVSSQIIKKRKVLIVGISQFPNPSSLLWDGFEEKIKVELGEDDVLVIDLRGNTGGDDFKGNWLASYVSSNKIVSPYTEPFDMNTPEAFAVMANAPLIIKTYFNEIPLEEADISWINKLKSLEERASQGEKVDLRLEFNRSDIKDGIASNFVHKGDIYLLIDNNCASSGESTTDFFENIPRVTRVGQNTAGKVHFGNNGFVMLPNSSLVIQLATSFNTYKDGRYIEKKGISPNVYIETGRDALDEVLKLIELNK